MLSGIPFGEMLTLLPESDFDGFKLRSVELECPRDRNLATAERPRYKRAHREVGLCIMRLNIV